MVTFLDLKEVDPRRLNDAATEWERMSAKLKTLESRVVRDLIRPIREARWKGDPAEIAYRTFDRLDDEFELTARQARNVATVLRFANREITRYKDALLALIREVNSHRFPLDERRGEVGEPPDYVAITSQPGGHQRYEQLRQMARELNTRIQRVVRDADQLDLRISQTLSSFQPYAPGRMDAREWNDAISDARTALSLVGEPETPKPDWTPQQNRAWWDRLTDDQRTLYLAAHPDRVGALDGMAAEVRHEANMTVLRDRIWAAPNSEGGTPRLNTLLDRIEGSEYGPQADRLYLLGINNTGDGLGIVSVGNPDTARHLGVAFVPGIRTTLDGMDYQIDRATVLRQTADAMTPGQGDVAVISWLGYDTPGIPDAPLHTAAESAAPVLDRFVDGQVVAQEAVGNTTSHRTIIAHSYGSAAVGIAASTGDGLRVHDIIAAGSPGMHVNRATEFVGISPRNVWIGRGDYDVVPYIGPPSHGAPNIPNIYGTAPHFESFGANRFVVDTTGHNAYWTPNSQSLTNQAHILVGQYRQVGLVHGRPPGP